MKKSKPQIFFILVVVFIVATAFTAICAVTAEAPKLEYQNHYVEPREAWAATYGQQTSDGGYIIVGMKYIGNFGTSNWTGRGILIKTNDSLQQVWVKDYDGAPLFSVKQTKDGGYIAAGTILTPNKTFQSYLVKTDVNGNEQWHKTFNGRDGRALDVQQTSDGGYIIVGRTNSTANGNWTAYVIKTDTNGSESWSRLYDSKNVTALLSVEQTKDGGYIAAGVKKCDGCDYTYGWLLKIDTKGTTVWDKMYGEGVYHDVYSVQQTKDGGYIAAGRDRPKGFNSTYGWIFKVDSKGNSSGFEHEYGYYNNSDNEFSSVQNTKDGGYIVAGNTAFANKTSLAYIMKTDSAGHELWNQTLFFKEHSSCNCEFVLQTSDGGYFVVGGVGNDFSSVGSVWAAKLMSEQSGQSLVEGAFTVLTDNMGNYVNQVVVGIIGSISVAALTRLFLQVRRR